MEGWNPLIPQGGKRWVKKGEKRGDKKVKLCVMESELYSQSDWDICVMC